MSYSGGINHFSFDTYYNECVRVNLLIHFRDIHRVCGNRTAIFLRKLYSNSL